MQISKTHILKVLNLVLTVGLLTLIWGNSLLVANRSAAISGGLLSWLQAKAPILHWMAEGILRKLAHFSEFAALGACLGWGCFLWELPKHSRTLLPMLSGLLIALTDETIQLFVEGRSGEIRDVWIDFAGICTGIVCIRLVLRLWSKVSEKRLLKNRQTPKEKNT